MTTGTCPDTPHSLLPYNEDGPNSQGTITLPYSIVAGMATANAQLIAEVARLQAEVARLKAPIQTLHRETPGRETIESTGDGSGAGSPEEFQAICKRNWHGRLGRAHMADVDRLPDMTKKALDGFLRQKITSAAPVGGKYIDISPNAIFSPLSDFGLRLEDRGPFADVTIFNDADYLSTATIARLRNFSAYFYKGGGGTYELYWKASALETLVELARYRGLFDKGGFLKSVN